MDLLGERLRLTAAKRERYAAHAEEVAKGKVCDMVSFRRLLGRLTSAVQCYPIGRQRLHAAWRASRACYRMGGGAIAVSKAVQLDLQWWAAELRRAGRGMRACRWRVQGRALPRMCTPTRRVKEAGQRGRWWTAKCCTCMGSGRVTSGSC